MIKVKVENFQSIRKAEVEIDGLTVITGPNNSGKSALMRAVRGVFTNTPGVAFVRRGQDTSSVELEFDDGNIVKWEKGRKIKPTYTINNGKPVKPGRAVPDEVLKMGVRPIQAGNQDLWPQIAPQIHGQVFLINKPGSTIAEAVADVERVGTLNGAMRLAEKDVRATRSILKIRRQDGETLSEELEAYKGFDALDTLVAELESAQKALGVLGKRILTLRNLRDRKTQTEAIIEELGGVLELEVPSDELVENLGETARAIKVLHELHRRKTQTDGLIESLGGVQDVDLPSDEPVEKLGKIQGVIKLLSSLRDQLTKAEADVERYQGAEDLSDLEFPEGKLSQITTAVGDLRGIQQRRESALEDIEESKEALEAAQSELKRVQKEVDEVLVTLDECPTCGGDTHE
jgi:exonuclease SbcC